MNMPMSPVTPDRGDRADRRDNRLSRHRRRWSCHVPLHGLDGLHAVDGPTADMSPGYRCVAPTLPLCASSSHEDRRRLVAACDARLVSEFLDASTCVM
jgi:hypothetical protein